MSSTPLLQSGGLPGAMQDHPVFLRASHSPWKCIPQNVLVVLRGVTLAYLAGTSVMIAHYKLNVEECETKLEHFFSFTLMSHLLIFLYHLITWAWTFTHLYHPDPHEVRGGVESLVVRAMSLPRNMGSLRKQFYFTMFHSTTTVFAFMNALIYWFVTRPHEAGGGDDALMTTAVKGLELLATPAVDAGVLTMAQMPEQPWSDLFGEGWFKAFILITLHAINPAIMVIEMLFFNSIKRPFALGSHFVGLMVMSGLYLGWAAIGKAVTGEFAFFWLDEEQVGSKEAVTTYCAAFVFLSQIMYTLMQGFIYIREGLTKSIQGGDGSDGALHS